MCPAFPINNSSNAALGNSIFFCERHYRDISFSNFFYLFFIQNYFWSPNSPEVGMSALFNHIGHIVFMVTHKKMIWPNTQSIVASVADKFISRDFPISQNPSHPVSKFWRSFITKPSISIFCFCSTPFPTSFSLFGFIPKSFHKYALIDITGGCQFKRSLYGFT